MSDMTIELNSDDYEVLINALTAWDDDNAGSKYAEDIDPETASYRTAQYLHKEQHLVFDFDRLVGFGYLERDEQSINDMGGPRYRITDRGRDILKAEDQRTAIVEYRVLNEDLLVLRAARRAFVDDTALGSKVIGEDLGYRTAKYLYSTGYEAYEWVRTVKAGWLQLREAKPLLEYRITQAGLDVLKAHDRNDEADLANANRYDAPDAPVFREINDLSEILSFAPDMNNNDLYLEGIAVGRVEAEREMHQAVKAHFAAYSPRAEYDDVEAINPALVFAEVTILIDAERQKREQAESLSRDTNRITQRYVAGFSQLAMLFDALSEIAHEQDEYGNYAGDLRGAAKLASLVSDRLNRDLVDDVREPDTLPRDSNNSDWIPF